ncbi:eCIS core domain-containing protein [Streptomyces sp. SAI-170]|uniref:eCIS core domain-containing protein n=1 Tax=Streptomyces sp. SAI-170 TaxID=3377729 RepID=UPI003C7C5561
MSSTAPADTGVPAVTARIGPPAASLPAFTPSPAAPAPAQPAPFAATRRGGSAPVRAAIAQPGRALPPSLLGQMEAGFGRGLSHVRVHDGPAAVRAAAALDARAFSLGPHLVFGAGEYRPDTPGGRGLIAHELAHVLQSPAAGQPHAAVVDDPRTEAEADRAVHVLAAGGRPVLAPLSGAPVIRRAGKGTAAPPPLPATTPVSAPGPGAAPKAAAPQPGTATGPALRLPPGLNVITDEPAGLGTTELVVEMPAFTLPLEKGAGPWVQKAYDDAAAGGRLVFTPLIEGNSTASYESIAAYKEGGEKYKDIWLGAYGFSNTTKLADAITTAAATDDKVRGKLADPAVKGVVQGLSKSLKQSQCDIDHIVEKQMGGTSIPSNLQLLTSTKNQASGRETYQALVDVVKQIRDPAMRGPGVRRLQIRIAKATVPTGQPDASHEIETLLRSGAVRGSDAVKAKAAGKPVLLTAGGQGETVQVRDTGETPLDTAARRIVPGMRIEKYKRAAAGAKSTRDTVEGELDSRAVSTTKAGSAVTLEAELVPAAAPAPATAAGPETTADPTAAPPGEARKLRLDKAKNAKIAFFYPYLSPGELTKVALDEQGNLTGEGVIHASVPFLGKLNVRYTKDELKLVAPIPAAKLVSPLPGAFRFTGGELALQLSPTLVPNGTLTFSVGPAAKPVMLGTLTVAVRNGALVAAGDLTPAGKLPGINAAAGHVEWNSETGWSGKITADSTAIPRSTANVEIGFTTASGRFDPYATGGVTTTVRNSRLELGARWDGQALSYRGSVTVDKPLPLVNSVRLSGRYGERGLYLQGEADVVWKQFKATMKVDYNRKEEEEEGRFSGAATIALKTEKADGSVSLNFDEEGRYWGKGSVAYQVTKNLRPVLGVEITKDRRIKLSGEAAVGDIVLVRKWPSPEGGTVPLLKGIGAKFSFPTPVPAVTAYIELRGSLNLGYGVGPIVLKAVVFKGELYPFEDDPQVAAKLTGTFAVPAYAELAGTFGAYIGAEVALGAVGAKGGIDIMPKLRLDGEGGVAFAADYDKDGFSFNAEAYAKGQLTASAKVLLAAELYAAWGLFSHRWTYEVASVSARLGPELKLTLGRIAYAKNGEITWPSLSQIKVEPESIDPVQIIKDMLGRGEAVET